MTIPPANVTIVQKLGAPARGAMLTHLQRLSHEDRRLRFGVYMTDPALAHYVADIDFAHDHVFGILGSDLTLLGMAHYTKTSTDLISPERAVWKRECIVVPKPGIGIPDPWDTGRKRVPTPFDINFERRCTDRWEIVEQAQYKTRTEQWMWGWMECKDTCTGKITKTWMPDRQAQ